MAAAIRTRGHVDRAKPVKKNKATVDCLAGKRIIDLSIARALAPSVAYLYETVDLTKIRVFVGKERKSTHAKVNIGRPLAIMKCLKWSWDQVEKGPGAVVCPHDFTKIKLQ